VPPGVLGTELAIKVSNAQTAKHKFTEDLLMRRLFLIAGLMTAFGLAVLAASAASANFAGTWVLDKTKSQGLSQRMQGADKVTWTITQDDKTISLDQKVEGGQPPAGGGGGGGGMGGGRPPAGPTAYNLDGKEVTSDLTLGQMTGKQTLKTTWAGDALELSRKSVFTTEQGERTSINTQKLSLSDGGKVLTAVVHSEGGRGAQDSTLVFNKQ
jgi:polyisoprenoid-binding protein YceI